MTHSSTEEARTRRASELLDAIRAAGELATLQAGLQAGLQAAARDVELLHKQVVVPQGWKLVKIELLERIQESLGSFISDQGWSQSDMDTADALGGLLATAPQPACNLFSPGPQ